MSVKISTVPSRRGRGDELKKIPGAISRWSSGAERAAAYSQAESGADPRMMGADVLKFDPRQMVSGVSLGKYETDSSHQRVVTSQEWIPVIYGIGALVLFLGVMNFLKK